MTSSSLRPRCSDRSPALDWKRYRDLWDGRIRLPCGNPLISSAPLRLYIRPDEQPVTAAPAADDPRHRPRGRRLGRNHLPGHQPAARGGPGDARAGAPCDPRARLLEQPHRARPLRRAQRARRRHLAEDRVVVLRAARGRRGRRALRARPPCRALPDPPRARPGAGAARPADARTDRGGGADPPLGVVAGAARAPGGRLPAGRARSQDAGGPRDRVGLGRERRGRGGGDRAPAGARSPADRPDHRAGGLVRDRGAPGRPPGDARRRRAGAGIPRSRSRRTSRSRVDARRRRACSRSPSLRPRSSPSTTISPSARTRRRASEDSCSLGISR